jgi:putative sigma-54 modulation protein
MKIDINAKNYRVTDRLSVILENKIAKLSKYFPDEDTTCKVVLTDLGRQCRMELSINYHGVVVRAEVTGDTMYYNIDEALPKIERQIVKYREKFNTKKKMPKADTDYQFVSDVVIAPVSIAKTKTFVLEAMSPTEAAENLELVGHDFYVFENRESGNTEVVYRRHDGSVGLLKPTK